MERFKRKTVVYVVMYSTTTETHYVCAAIVYRHMGDHVTLHDGKKRFNRGDSARRGTTALWSTEQKNVFATLKEAEYAAGLLNLTSV